MKQIILLLSLISAPADAAVNYLAMTAGMVAPGVVMPSMPTLMPPALIQPQQPQLPAFQYPQYQQSQYQFPQYQHLGYSAYPHLNPSYQPPRLPPRRPPPRFRHGIQGGNQGGSVFGSLLKGFLPMFSEMFSGLFKDSGISMKVSSVGNTLNDDSETFAGTSALKPCTNCGARRPQAPARIPLTFNSPRIHQPPPAVQLASAEVAESSGDGFSFKDFVRGGQRPNPNPNPPAVAPRRVVRERRGLTPRREVPVTRSDRHRIQARSRQEIDAQKQPVWNTFIAKFKACEPGCEPTQYHSRGQRGNRSCHPSGRAIDVHAMVCNGRIYKAINRGRFERMVLCMRDRMGMPTLWRNGRHITSGHKDHAHFSIRCEVGGRTVR